MWKHGPHQEDAISEVVGLTPDQRLEDGDIGPATALLQEVGQFFLSGVVQQLAAVGVEEDFHGPVRTLQSFEGIVGDGDGGRADWRFLAATSPATWAKSAAFSCQKPPLAGP